MFDIYEKNDDNSSRFLLGKSGKKKLFVIGLNPSTATDIKPDATITRVNKVAIQNGFDGFLMLNLYPLRATYPTDLPTLADVKLVQENVSYFVTECRFPEFIREKFKILPN
jgi:hypothetical protein